MSRTWTTAVAVVALVLTAAPSGADEAQGRTIAAPYAAGAGIDCERALGCVALVPRKGEKYVHFTVHDVGGVPVYGTVTHKRRSSPQVFGEGDEFCGTGSYHVAPGKPVYLYFENHLGSWHGCPGGASRGLVLAEFVVG